MKNEKKIYESKKIYSKNYNKRHSTIQIDRELYEELKVFLKDKDVNIRDYVAELIKKSFKTL